MVHDLYILFNAVKVKFDVKESFHGLFILIYFINGTSLMGTLFQKALYFKVFFYWIFCVCLFMFTENLNKTGKMTAKMCGFFFFKLRQSVY